LPNKLVWLVFDLGVKGDYEALYAWLDTQGARECGDSVACFTYSYTDDLVTELRAHLESAMTIDKKSRLYVLYSDPDTNRPKGSFLFGRRKSPPWAGYGPVAIQEEDRG
jgi:hypothetical protein